MKFSTAMSFLEEGKKVRCTNWGKKEFICLSPLFQCVHDEDGYKSVDFAADLLEEWELFEEPEKLLSFADVVKGLREGKRFKRRGWNLDDAWVVSKNEWRGSVAVEGRDRNTFILEDFEATDWIEIL